MRDELMAGLVAGVLAVMTTSLAAAVDDEPQALLTELEYELERVEIAAADLTMLLPVDWDIDTTMRQDEYRLPPDMEQTSVESLEIVYAENELGEWCSLTTFEAMPLTPEEHAWLEGARVEDGSGGQFVASDTIWLIGDEIGHRSELTPDSGFGGVHDYVWDMDGTRYVLRCASSMSTNRSWPDIADSVEVTSADALDETDADDVADVEVVPASIEIIGDVQRVEVPDAGIAVSLPAEWDVDVQMERRELPVPGDADAEAATEWSVLYAPMPEASGWCNLVMVTDMPVTFDEWSDGFLPEPAAGGRPTSVDAVVLPVGEAVRVHDEHVEGELIFATLYLFESNGAYYWFGCASGAPAEDRWLGVAETLEPLGDDVDDATGLQRVEVPGSGVAVSFPADWNVDIEMTEMELAPTDPEQSPVSYLNVLYAQHADGSWCQLQRNDVLIDDLVALADSVAEGYLTEYGDEATVAVSTIGLEVGQTARVEGRDPAEGKSTLFYIFRSEDALFELSCMSAAADVPVLDEIAGTLAWPGSPDGPAARPDVAVVSSDAVAGFDSEVEVAEGMLMSADCELAVWVSYDDGSFREWIDCMLSDAPVSQPEWQGSRPEELLTVRGSECEWTSDYWAVTDGSEVWATSYELTITPDGRVFGSSAYAAEALDCSD